MARWRINAKHYIHAEKDGEPTQWEYEETARATGRKKRLRFTIPMFVDPEDPSCCNKEGDCVVAFEGDEHLGDIIVKRKQFHPTPEMTPLDDEAQRISDEHMPQWAHPIDTLPANGDIGTALIQMFEKQMLELGKGPSAPRAIDTVSKADFDALKSQLENFMAAASAPRHEPSEPFEEIEPTPEEIAAAQPKPEPAARRV